MLILNYKDTPNGPPETRWSDANKEAFLKAVHGGKGLVVYHFASARLRQAELGGVREGGRRRLADAGLPRPGARLHRQEDRRQAPDLRGAPGRSSTTRSTSSTQNSMLTPGSEVLATAYSDPSKPRGTGKDEPVIWVNHYGKGRVYENVLGHDTKAMADPNYQNGCAGASSGRPPARPSDRETRREAEGGDSSRTARLQHGAALAARPRTVRRAVRGRARGRTPTSCAAPWPGRGASGRNPENGAIAVLAIHRDRVLVAILQEATCLTVLTWNQFVPRLAEFGRSKLPRKWGRTLRRLTDPSPRNVESGDPEPRLEDSMKDRGTTDNTKYTKNTDGSRRRRSIGWPNLDLDRR